MNWVFFIIVVVTLIVLFCPLFFQTRFYFNVFCNMATVSITFLGVFVLKSFQVELRKNALNFLTTNKKGNKEKQVLISEINRTFAYIFFKQVFLKLKINEIAVFGAVGKKDDAFFPAVLSGVFLTLVHSFLAIMQTKKGSFSVCVGTTVDCDENVFKTSGFLSVRISFFKLIVCLINAIYCKIKIRRRYEKHC